MNRFKQVFLIPLVVFALVIFASSASAYEKEQLVDCIASAKENIAIKGVSENSIENYCDCALELIVDKNKNVQESGYECAVKSFE
ncbi:MULTISPECIES: hypothetical protein [Prochlorococcus]|uniref:hypothetical protein n=1 Tax=Prochlorococcus TaxID=1218 RepID=UPI00055E1228|nr:MULTISPECIES: hypothetical protein [Prochlorococcus]